MSLINRGIGVYRAEGLTGVVKRIRNRVTHRKEPILELSSEYLNWLQFANAGMLVPGNIWCMDYAIRNLQSAAPIVEIGSFCGLSANVITYLKEKHKVKNPLLTCDRWLFEGAETGGMLGDSQSLTHVEYRDFVKQTFLRNVQMFSRSDLPYTFELFSNEFFDAWANSRSCTDVFGREFQLGGPVSFCYIDGNHSYDFARQDFENCDRFLEKAGFLLFDDSSDDSDWEVRKVVREVLDTKRYDLIARNPNYFFRKK